MALLDQFKKKSTVMVTFINRADYSIIGRSELSSDQLPETFALNTVMHLGDEDWEVLSAEPSDKISFVQTGELILTMQRIEQMNPADILFSLPTISNELPEFSDITFSVNFTHILREDDWRQCEFFDIHQKDKILSELTKIEVLKNDHQKSTQSDLRAFNKIHVRDLQEVPELSFSLMAFLSQLQISDVGAIRFEDHEQYIAQGFAVETLSNMFYGILGLNCEGSTGLDNLVVRVLGVQPKSDDREEISQLLQNFNLMYVDWCDAYSIDRLN